MSKIWPSGEIKLYNIPQSDILSGKALVFSSATEREQYFESYRIATESPVTVVKKKKNPIRLGVDIATIKQATYMSWINPDFDNKLYYAIIKDYDYVNNNVTEVTFMIDWWYTDMFNVVFERCNMAREGLTVKEKHYLDINPYDVNCCEKMRSDEPLQVNKELEMAYYDLGNIETSGGYYERGHDGGNIVAELEVQNVDGHDNLHSKVSWPYSDYTPVDDSLPMIPCVMFSSIDFKYLDTEFPETRDVQTFTEASANWLRSTSGTDWETYCGTTYVKPSERFKALLNGIRGTSKFYLIKYPRNGVMNLLGNAVNTIYNFSWSSQGATGYYEGTLNDAKLNLTQSLYARPYYIVAAAPWVNLAGDIVNPVQEIINLLTEWGMSSSILSVYLLPAYVYRLSTCRFENAKYIQRTGKGQYPSMNQFEFLLSSSFERKKHYVSPSESSYESFYYGDSPKLLQAPYSYLSIENGSGNGVLDLRYEDIAEPIQYTTQGVGTYYKQECKFALLSDLNVAGINVAVFPLKGKRKIKLSEYRSGQGNVMNYALCDPANSLSISEFPQAPYTTDAFLGFLASVNQQIVAGSDKNSRLGMEREGLQYNGLERFARGIESLKTLGKSIIDVNQVGTDIANRNWRDSTSSSLGDLANDAQKIARGINKERDFNLASQIYENKMGLVEDANKGALTNLKGSKVADMYSPCSSAFAMRNFNVGTNGGVFGTNKCTTGERLYYIHHKLRLDITKTYDDWFRLFGYTTRKYKKPAIAYYITEGYSDVNDYANVTWDYDSSNWDSASNLKAYGPEWETFDNENVFFTQTENCLVTGVCQDSRDFIEALFNGGCRFVRPTPITHSNS